MLPPSTSIILCCVVCRVKSTDILSYSLQIGAYSHACIYAVITVLLSMIPDNKVHGANIGPIWGRQDPGGPHVGPMNLAIWDIHTSAVLS